MTMLLGVRQYSYKARIAFSCSNFIKVDHTRRLDCNLLISNDSFVCTNFLRLSFKYALSQYLEISYCTTINE